MNAGIPEALKVRLPHPEKGCFPRAPGGTQGHDKLALGGQNQVSQGLDMRLTQKEVALERGFLGERQFPISLKHFHDLRVVLPFLRFCWTVARAFSGVNAFYFLA